MAVMSKAIIRVVSDLRPRLRGPRTLVSIYLISPLPHQGSHSFRSTSCAAEFWKLSAGPALAVLLS